MSAHIHNQYEEDRAFVLEQANVLLNDWRELPHDRISDEDYKIGISLERQRNKYRHGWFEGIVELAAIIDSQGLGSIAERSKIKNIATALAVRVGEERSSTPPELVRAGDQLLRRMIDVLKQ